MVHSFASGFRNRRWTCGRAPAELSDPREYLVCSTGRNRGSRNHSTTRERGEPLMKMMWIRILSALAVLNLAMLAGCNTRDGAPQTNSEPVAPSQVLEFDTLYALNCAGSHGAQGRGGA